MRLIALAAFAGLLATAAHADTMKNCAAAWEAKTPDAKSAGTYKAWSATCLKAEYEATVPDTDTAAPTGATAKCKDRDLQHEPTS
jgi:invasion protein IalB